MAVPDSAAQCWGYRSTLSLLAFYKGLGTQIQIPVLVLQELYRLSLSPGLISAFYVLCVVILDSIIIKVFSSMTVPVLLFPFSSKAQLALILANAGM